MVKPRLNTRQRNWLKNFLAQYSCYKLERIVEGLNGDRICRRIASNPPAFQKAGFYSGVIGSSQTFGSSNYKVTSISNKKLSNTTLHIHRVSCSECGNSHETLCL